MTRFFIVFMITIAAVFFISAGNVCGQDDANNSALKTIDGSVISVDAQNSRIVVKTFENYTFSVPSNAKITGKDGFDIPLSNISVGNYAMVDYYDDPSGKHIAKNIEVEYNR